MAPHPTTILGLALCLGQMIHMQNGLLPPPSITAEPGPEVPRVRPVTILCQGPAGAHTFRLEQKNRSTYTDQKITSQHGSPGTEARFLIRAAYLGSVHRVHRGPHRPGLGSVCLVYADPVTDLGHCGYIILLGGVSLRDPLTLWPGGPGEVTPLPTEVGSQTAPASRKYMAGNCIRLGLAGVVLLILVAILAETGLSQRTSPH